MIDPLAATAGQFKKPVKNQAQDQVSLEDDLEPIALVEDDELDAPATSSKSNETTTTGKRIIAFGGDLNIKEKQWKRKLTSTGTGASRVRSFHGKYSDEGLRYLDDAINGWLDEHPEIEVKFVTSTVMTFEGKIREPALVLNVWY